MTIPTCSPPAELAAAYHHIRGRWPWELIPFDADQVAAILAELEQAGRLPDSAEHDADGSREVAA